MLKAKRNFWHSAIKWTGQHFKNRIPDTMPPAAIAQRRFVPWKFIQFHLTDWLSAVAHVRPSQNTQKRCATPTHPVYDRFSATPTGQIPLFSKRFSLSTRATAYGTLSPLLPALKLQIWTLPSSFSALLTFRVYLLMSLERRLFKSTDVLQHPPAPFPRQIFVELMEMAASSVEFSFNDIMHRQIDGLAMGSPPWTSPWQYFCWLPWIWTFSDQFQTGGILPLHGWHLRSIQQWRWMRSFLISVNSLHPSLRFTFEKKRI